MTIQYIYVGTGERDVKLWNNGVTIWELTKTLIAVIFVYVVPIPLLYNLDVWENLNCSYYLTTGYLFYYCRIQYDHKMEKESGRFGEVGGMTSAALSKSDVILFENDLITNKQANCIVPL